MLSVEIDAIGNIALSIKKFAQNHFDWGLSYYWYFDGKFDTWQSNFQDCQPRWAI
jgi:hypothetical protein